MVLINSLSSTLLSIIDHYFKKLYLCYHLQFHIIINYTSLERTKINLSEIKYFALGKRIIFRKKYVQGIYICTIILKAVAI